MVNDRCGSSKCIIKYQDYHGNSYIFDHHSYCVFKYSALLEDLITSVSQSFTDDNLYLLKQKYPEVDLEKQIKLLSDLRVKIKHDPQITSDSYDSLWLNISHICNLRCVYCYGVDGSYGTAKELMSIEEAKKTIDYWIHHLNREDDEVKVTFFGGEPTMNKEVLLFSVSYIESLLSDQYLIKYRITTNGTVLDKDLLNIFKSRNFAVTVSMDGDEESHNRNRPLLSGEGSFQKVLCTILSMQDYGIKGVSVRLTIVHENVKHIETYVKELWGRGVETIALNIVSSLDNKYVITDHDIEILRYQIHNLAIEMVRNPSRRIYNLDLYAYLINNQIVNKCLYFSKHNLLVETEGDVYRCHRLVGNNQFKLGNIFSGQALNRSEMENRPVSPKCEQCWANKLCTSCPQINYVYHNDINEPYHVYCNFNKMMIKEGLRYYTSVRVSD